MSGTSTRGTAKKLWDDANHYAMTTLATRHADEYKALFRERHDHLKSVTGWHDSRPEAARTRWDAKWAAVVERALQYLTEHPDASLGDYASAFELGTQSASRHLNRMRDEGLVDFRWVDEGRTSLKRWSVKS